MGTEGCLKKGQVGGKIMYAFIKGKIESKFVDCVIVEANGIGFRIYTSMKTLESIGMVNEEVKLHTYLHVREDARLLYGFFTKEELTCFELLISVSGVGPKASIALLSKYTPSKISLAIVSGDYKLLKEAPGIGLKIAQRVVLELKDKIMKDSKDVELAEAIFAEQTAGMETGGVVSKEAISALVVLGYTQIEAGKIVARVYRDGMLVEEIIKEALRQGI